MWRTKQTHYYQFRQFTEGCSERNACDKQGMLDGLTFDDEAVISRRCRSALWPNIRGLGELKQTNSVGGDNFSTSRKSEIHLFAACSFYFGDLIKREGTERNTATNRMACIANKTWCSDRFVHRHLRILYSLKWDQNAYLSDSKFSEFLFGLNLLGLKYLKRFHRRTDSHKIVKFSKKSPYNDEWPSRNS